MVVNLFPHVTVLPAVLVVSTKAPGKRNGGSGSILAGFDDMPLKVIDRYVD